MVLNGILTYLSAGHILCLPIPEKTQRSYNFCVIHSEEEEEAGGAGASSGVVLESMVFSIPDAPPRTAFLGSGTPVTDGAGLGETYQSYITNALNGELKHTRVVCPEEKEFVSPVAESHRKGEKAYHVKAFKGTKEGGFSFFFSFSFFPPCCSFPDLF